MRTKRLVVLPLLVPLASCLSTGGARHDQSLGLAVRTTAEGGMAATAGLRPGDVLLTWQSEDASGKLESPFDVMDLQVEHTNVGPVTLTARAGSGGPDRTRAGKLGLTAWPVLGGERDQQLGEAMAAEREQRVGALEELASREVRGGVRAWLLTEAARAADEPSLELGQAASAAVGDNSPHGCRSAGDTCGIKRPGGSDRVHRGSVARRR
jgi:hypothetical protein